MPFLGEGRKRGLSRLAITGFQCWGLRLPVLSEDFCDRLRSPLGSARPGEPEVLRRGGRRRCGRKGGVDVPFTRRPATQPAPPAVPPSLEQSAQLDLFSCRLTWEKVRLWTSHDVPLRLSST